MLQSALMSSREDNMIDYQSLTKKRELKIWDVVDVQPAEAVVRPAMDCRAAVKITDPAEQVVAIN
jgi:hypothetical protein